MSLFSKQNPKKPKPYIPGTPEGEKWDRYIDRVLAEIALIASLLALAIRLFF